MSGNGHPVLVRKVHRGFRKGPQGNVGSVLRAALNPSLQFGVGQKRATSMAGQVLGPLRRRNLPSEMVAKRSSPSRVR